MKEKEDNRRRLHDTNRSVRIVHEDPGNVCLCGHDGKTKCVAHSFPKTVDVGEAGSPTEGVGIWDKTGSLERVPGAVGKLDTPSLGNVETSTGSFLPCAAALDNVGTRLVDKAWIAIDGWLQ